MKQLRDSIAVPLPANVTEENLLRYFESRRGVDGTISLPLRLSPAISAFRERRTSSIVCV